MTTNYNEIEILSAIQQLIDKNRCGIDGFFTDSKTAAKEIFKFLASEKIIMKNERALEVAFDKQSKAA